MEEIKIIIVGVLAWLSLIGLIVLFLLGSSGKRFGKPDERNSKDRYNPQNYK